MAMSNQINDREYNKFLEDSEGNVSIRTSPAIAESLVLTASGAIKEAPGKVYSIVVSAVGVTAGDKIEILNSVDNSGDSLITLTASAANQTITLQPAVGINFDTGIYYKETKTGGAFTTTVVYA